MIRIICSDVGFGLGGIHAPSIRLIAAGCVDWHELKSCGSHLNFAVYV